MRQLISENVAPVRNIVPINEKTLKWNDDMSKHVFVLTYTEVDGKITSVHGIINPKLQGQIAVLVLMADFSLWVTRLNKGCVLLPLSTTVHKHPKAPYKDQGIFVNSYTNHIVIFKALRE